MSISDQLQTLARREYALLRTVAKAVDERLEPAVSASPGLTSALSRVREVLHDIDERVTGAGPATAPSPNAAARPKPNATVTAPEPVAADEEDEAAPDEIEPAEVEHLAEELLEEEDDHHAGELADNEDLRDVQARLRAKHALQEFNEKQT